MANLEEFATKLSPLVSELTQRMAAVEERRTPLLGYTPCLGGLVVATVAQRPKGPLGLVVWVGRELGRPGRFSRF